MNEKFPENLDSKQSKEKYEKIDRKSPEIIEALKKAPIYRKNAMVQARRIETGEAVITKLADDFLETENTALEESWEVINPTGEKYILPTKMFEERYVGTDEPDKYQAIGHIRAIKNPFHKPIEIQASWGSPQFGDSDCFIADVCDADGEDMAGEPYLIGIEEF